MSSELTAISEQVSALCREAGTFQLQHFRSIPTHAISDKGLNQLVSFVDVETEKMLVSGLQKILPEAGFVTEENTVATQREGAWTWIIDPLDGTTNFLHGIPAFCISVALAKNGIPVCGVIYIPVWNELFTAVQGNGAFLNHEKIQVTDTVELKDTLLATGFPYYEFEYMDGYLQVLRDFMKNTHGLRRMGSAAIDLAYTACGRFDGFFELGLHAWDVAAGALMVQEAGGKVSDFQNGNNYLFGKSIVASNANIFGDFLHAIQQKFRS